MDDRTRRELERRGVRIESPQPQRKALPAPQRRRGLLAGRSSGPLFNIPSMPDILATPDYMKQPPRTGAPTPGANPFTGATRGSQHITLDNIMNPEYMKQPRPTPTPLQPSMSLRPDMFSTAPTAPTPLAHGPTQAPATAPMSSEGGGAELPYQTYQRLFGKSWGNAGGGRGDLIRALLDNYSIAAAPGSAEANLALQAKLKEQFKI